MTELTGGTQPGGGPLTTVGPAVAGETVLTPDTAATRIRASAIARATGGRGGLAVLGGLAVTLAALPFEGAWLRALTPPQWTFVVTDVEALASLTVMGWMLLLLADRRRPRVPRGIAIALGALALFTALSAASAGSNALLGTQVTARAALAWGLFLVTVDLVREPRAALVLVAVLVAAAGVSALVGWIAAWRDSMDGLFGAGRLFSVGGVARMAGTWDYPTIAAMAWEAVLLLLLPVLAWSPGRGARRWLPLLIGVPCALVLGGAILMTLTRGAFLGLAAGLATLVVAAWLLRSRGLAVTALLAAGALTVGGATLYLSSSLPLARLLSESDAGLYGADYRATGSLAAAPGGQLVVHVTVRNTGLATWRPDGPQPWVLAAIWLSTTGTPITDHQVAATLPGPVPPGGSVDLQAVVSVPGMAGDLDLAWDMQQVGVVEFSERDVPVALTRVTIDPAAAARPIPVTEPRRVLLYPTMLRVLDRSELWTAAVRLVAKHPLLGVGPGAYRRIYGAELGLTRWDTQIHANDLYLELAATTGILGLGAFLMTVALGLRQSIRGLHATRGSRAGLAGLLIAGSMAATAAALGHGIVDHFLVFVPMAILFWVLLGLGVGLAVTVERGRPAPGTVPTP